MLCKAIRAAGPPPFPWLTMSNGLRSNTTTILATLQTSLVHFLDATLRDEEESDAALVAELNAEKTALAYQLSRYLAHLDSEYVVHPCTHMRNYLIHLCTSREFN